MVTETETQRWGLGARLLLGVHPEETCVSISTVQTPDWERARRWQADGLSCVGGDGLSLYAVSYLPRVWAARRVIWGRGDTPAAAVKDAADNLLAHGLTIPETFTRWLQAQPEKDLFHE